VLVLLEGALGIVFERPGGRTERHNLAPGATLIVPAGVWHRAVDQQGVRMLFITFGAGTAHRPVA
jgi:mannose-6-phosphate isomerase-like protein (cupin superfamily)